MSEDVTQPKSASRRSFLRKAAKIGGGSLVVISGGLVWRAFDQDIFSPTDGPAFQPWSDWKEGKLSGPMGLLPSAILASSPHNTQPWLFDVREDKIDIYADTERHLGSFDPYLREMHIGLGCALQNMMIAAPEYGYAADFQYHEASLSQLKPASGPRLAATLWLSKEKAARDPLYQQIDRRQTYRGRYDRSRQIDGAHLARYQQIAQKHGVELALFSADEERMHFDELVMTATQAIVTDMEMVHDSESWFRFHASDIEKHKDGVTMDSVGMPAAMTFLAKMAPPLSPEDGHNIWMNTTRDVHLATAPITAGLVVRDRFSLSDNLRAGRAWQEIHLAATEAGISMQPMNQPVEWLDRLEATGKLDTAEGQTFTGLMDRQFNDHGAGATFTFRMGYAGEKGKLSPRRSVAEVLMKS